MKWGLTFSENRGHFGMSFRIQFPNLAMENPSENHRQMDVSEKWPLELMTAT